MSQFNSLGKISFSPRSSTLKTLSPINVTCPQSCRSVTYSARNGRRSYNTDTLNSTNATLKFTNSPNIKVVDVSKGQWKGRKALEAVDARKSSEAQLQSLINRINRLKSEEDKREKRMGNLKKQSETLMKIRIEKQKHKSTLKEHNESKESEKLKRRETFSREKSEHEKRKSCSLISVYASKINQYRETKQIKAEEKKWLQKQNIEDFTKKMQQRFDIFQGKLSKSTRRRKEEHEREETTSMNFFTRIEHDREMVSQNEKLIRRLELEEIGLVERFNRSLLMENSISSKVHTLKDSAGSCRPARSYISRRTINTSNEYLL